MMRLSVAGLPVLSSLLFLKSSDSPVDLVALALGVLQAGYVHVGMSVYHRMELLRVSEVVLGLCYDVLFSFVGRDFPLE